MNYTPFPNIIKNQKYNIFSLIPAVLFVQFSLFSNQFYFLMAVSQFFDALKVGFLFSYIAPFALVLSITIIKEGYDDFCRYKRDKEANNQKYIKITETGKKEIRSSEIKIGDILELNQNERAPADLIIIKTYEEGSGLFIRTDQLDGETDWKLRKPPHSTQKHDLIQEIFNLNAYLLIDPPNRLIYEFNGILISYSKDGSLIKDPLGLENTMWSNTVLASKKLIGCVIYTGKETRAQMNSSTPRSKTGLLDLEVNKLTKILFIIMVICSFIIVMIKGISGNPTLNVINFFRFIVLLCSIIPISLRVNLDIAKTINSNKIGNDPIIEGTIPRNSTVPEELGRIEYVFTDKTGTLTKNEMIFKKISMEMDQFSEENFPDIKLIVESECQTNDSPMLDLINLANKGEYNFESNKRIRRNRSKVIRDAITAMALCNNVTPIIENGLTSYQASSPDEVALVTFAEKMGMRLIYRSDTNLKIMNSGNNQEEYKILANFPFSSDTKRMGIILKNIKNNKIFFYLKGAENVIEEFAKEDYKAYIKERSETLACGGLRTLVLTQKLLDNSFYNKWTEIYHTALTSMKDRKIKIAEAISLLENNMEFLCVTGVEDLLQDDVAETIESLRTAGIRIWMLTGDKVETATCIAISTGLKNKQQRITYIKETDNIVFIKDELEKFGYAAEGNVLIIDGHCLEIALTNCEKLFFESSMIAASVVCCRCSPTQKARIVRNIKKYTHRRICAIGDGGNDVAMIQEAHIGIGLVGKEGKQASLAADYSITKFKNLNLLLLWFGRLSYKNTSTVAKFILHRGLIISFLQFIFSIMFYCSSIPLYNGMLILGYTSVYTALPVISLLFDNDTDIKNVMKFPSLYKTLQKGRELSTKAFLWWFWKSLFQSAVIMIASIYMFENIYLKIATVTFTTLIFAELLNIYTEIKRFHYIMLVSLFGTLIVYIASLIFLKSVLDFYYLNIETIGKILLITVVTWLPFYLLSKFKRCIYPEAHEKLNSININN